MRPPHKDYDEGFAAGIVFGIAIGLLLAFAMGTLTLLVLA